MNKIKFIFPVAFIAIAVLVMIMGLRGNNSFFEYFPYIFWGVMAFFIVIFFALFLPSVLAYHLAYKTAAQIFSYPSDDPMQDRVEVEILNRGEGEIVIANVGLLDRRVVKQRTRRGTTTTWKDIPIYSSPADLNMVLPLRIAPRCIEVISLRVDRSKFERKFTGVFFDIDAANSEQCNKHAARLAKGDFSVGDCPKGFVRKNVFDKRLDKVFFRAKK